MAADFALYEGGAQAAAIVESTVLKGGGAHGGAYWPVFAAVDAPVVLLAVLGLGGKVATKLKLLR